jgi:hypothetical protein
MHIHHKKALSVFPEFSNFPGNFSNFSLHKNLIRIITNIKKKLAKSLTGNRTHQKEQLFSLPFWRKTLRSGLKK